LSAIDILAGLGGLHKTLTGVIALFIVPFTQWAHSAELLSTIFRWRPSYRNHKEQEEKKHDKNEYDPKQELCNQMNWDLKNTAKKIPYHGYCSLEYWTFGRKAHYKWKMARASNILMKEMDLPKFLQRQRATMFALMALLNRRQRYAIDRMSRPVLRESDNLEDTSPDDELNGETLGPVEIGTIVNSSDKVDGRLVEAYKARKNDEVD